MKCWQLYIHSFIYHELSECRYSYQFFRWKIPRNIKQPTLNQNNKGNPLSPVNNKWPGVLINLIKSVLGSLFLNHSLITLWELIQSLLIVSFTEKNHFGFWFGTIRWKMNLFLWLIGSFELFWGFFFPKPFQRLCWWFFSFKERMKESILTWDDIGYGRS